MLRVRLDAGSGKWLGEAADTSGRAHRAHGEFSDPGAACAAAALLLARLAPAGAAAMLGWSVELDPKSGSTYWWHRAKGTTGWTHPHTGLRPDGRVEPWQLSDRYTAEAECPSCRVKQSRIIYVDKAKPMERCESGSVSCTGVARCGCGHSWLQRLTIPHSALLPHSAAPAQRAAQHQQPTMTEDERELLETAEDTELAKDVFSEYTCRSIDFGSKHPSENITESASMSGVSLPAATYPLREALGDEIIAGQKLSSLQLEGALYACQRHSRFLPGASTPTRHGFFLGDGAGVGKGRQVSAIILDNFARGRRKHCWFSVSADLRLDAERDLNDIGACGINLIDGHKGIDGGMAKDGVLFSTYLMLVSSVSQSSGKQAAKGGKGAKRQKTRRMDQLIKWCGGAAFDGCIIFDECKIVILSQFGRWHCSQKTIALSGHKAKNYREGAGLGTKIGAAVVELQKALVE